MVAELLRRIDSALSPVLVPITTTGDRDRATSLTLLGGTGVFVKELHEALLTGAIDLAVHSAKDLPTVFPRELDIVAFPLRAEVADALVAREGRRFADLPVGARIGTSSRRRRALIHAVRPDLVLLDARGNVDTRLRKLDEGAYDALILAAAGLERLGLGERITELLDPEQFVPAPGQGALAVVCRRDDPRRALFARLDDPDVRLAVSVERAFLSAFGAGCSLPLGAYASVEGESVRLRVALGSSEKDPVLRSIEVWPRAEALERAARLGDELARRTLRAQSSARVGESSPLAGRRIVVLRPSGQEGELADRLRRLGADVLVNPLITIRTPADWSAVDDTLRRIDAFDWVVFTSVNGVRIVAERLLALGLPIDLLRPVKIAVIGPATARAVRQLGLEVTLVPERYVAEALAAALAAQGVRGRRVLLARAAEARDVLPQQLREAGALVEVVPVYHTDLAPLDESIRRQLEEGSIDWVLLTASSVVRALVAALGSAEMLSERVRVAAIGPITAATARELGLRVDVVADRHTTDGLIEAVVRAERSAR